MPLTAVYEYFSTYAQATSDYEVFSARGSEATEADIRAFETENEFQLSEEFREFSKSYLGGLCMFAKEEIWPAPKQGDVGAFWTFLRGLMVFGFSPDAPDELSIHKRLIEFRERFGAHDLVPFLKLYGTADRYCFDRRGQIVEFMHDDVTNPRVVDSSFSDLLMHEIRELEARTRRRKETQL